MSADCCAPPASKVFGVVVALMVVAVATIPVMAAAELLKPNTLVLPIEPTRKLEALVEAIWTWPATFVATRPAAASVVLEAMALLIKPTASPTAPATSVIASVCLAPPPTEISRVSAPATANVPATPVSVL